MVNTWPAWMISPFLGNWNLQEGILSLATIRPIYRSVLALWATEAKGGEQWMTYWRRITRAFLHLLSIGERDALRLAKVDAKFTNMSYVMPQW